MDADLEKLADTYLRHHMHQRDEDFWAFEAVQNIVCKTTLERAWEITLLLLNKAESNNALEYVAAGPLEDTIDIYSGAAFELVETEASVNPRVSRAMIVVDIAPDHELFDRYRAFMQNHSSLTSNPQDPS